MEYYSVFKRNGVLIHTTRWKNLENIRLTERSQSQEVTYCVKHPEQANTEIESRLVVVMVWGK